MRLNDEPWIRVLFAVRENQERERSDRARGIKRDPPKKTWTDALYNALVVLLIAAALLWGSIITIGMINDLVYPPSVFRQQ